MRVLVTGGAGFLGRHISRRLLHDGHRVVVFDMARPSESNIDWLQGDLRDSEQVDAAVADMDVVCHVGAIGDVYLATEKPEIAAAVNVTGSVNVGVAAARHGARVIYASTWEVYGRPVYEPMDEDHPCDPDHPYNITKLAGERMLLALGRTHHFPVLSLRLGTAYGVGLRPNSVFRIFIDRARNGEAITVQGDGSQSRQFTHASDIARAFSLACESTLGGIVLNIVGSEVVTIKELAKAVVERYPVDLSFGPSRAGDISPALVSSERARQLLGWHADTSFQAGLTELLDWD